MESRRILKPSGSAVFIIQPNSSRIGSMRGWVWKFMYWITEEWNMVQDIYWWNPVVLPNGLTTIGKLTRPSVKNCVWAGSNNCYRNQDRVKWEESMASKARYATARANGDMNKDREYRPSGHSVKWSNFNKGRCGSTPFNMIPVANSNSSKKHGAGTPQELSDWWARYICPNNGTVLDMFMGEGTMGESCSKYSLNFIGIEKYPLSDIPIDKKTNPNYFFEAERRIAEAYAKPRQLNPDDLF